MLEKEPTDPDEDFYFLKDIDTHKSKDDLSPGKKMKDRETIARDHMSLMIDQFNPTDPFNDNLNRFGGYLETEPVKLRNTVQKGP